MATSMPSASWDSSVRRLRSCHEFELLASGLVSGATVWIGIVGDTERSDDKLARLHGLYHATYFLDEAAIFVSHRLGLSDG